VAAPFFLLGYAVGWAVDTVATTIDDLVTYMKDTGTSVGDAVKGILKAIIDSVTGGITDVANAFKDLAMAGVKAFKNAIEMKSPPRVFVRIGEAIPDAVAGGVDKGQPAVARSLSEMVDPGDMAPNGAPVGSASQSAKQGEMAASYVLNYYGNGSRSDAQQFAQWHADELERALLAKGLPA
jgi:phage-related protein